MNKVKRILCAALSVCLISVPVSASVFDVNAENVGTLQEQLENLEQKNKEYQEILDKTQSDIAEKEEYNQALVSKITVLDEKISLTRESISELSDSISETQKDIDKANDEMEGQVDALCDRLRAIYMAGSASDLEIILGAKDFSDLIDKVTLVKTLSKYDKELIDEVNEKHDAITEKKQSLEADKSELEEKEASLSADLDELNKTLEDNQEILKDLYITSDEAKNFLSTAGDKQKQIEAEIAKYFAEQEAAAKKAAAEKAKQNQSNSNSSGSNSSNSSSNSSQSTQTTEPSTTYEEPTNSQDNSSSYVPASSGYTWPCPGFYYISSPFGDTEDRGYGHGAIDIAGSGIMGAPVVAAESGTVSYTYTSCFHNWGKQASCGCGGGFGNYVWMNHGNGKETIYGHLTSVVVSPGQYVTKGQVVGYVGSTGNSTGPHLHFECRYGGVKYDPMSEF